MTYLTLQKSRRKAFLLPPPLLRQQDVIRGILCHWQVPYVREQDIEKRLYRLLSERESGTLLLPEDFLYREPIVEAGVPIFDREWLYRARFIDVARNAIRQTGLSGKRLALWANTQEEVYAFCKAVLSDVQMLTVCCPEDCKILCDSLTHFYGIPVIEGRLGSAVKCEAHIALDCHLSLPAFEKIPQLALLRGSRYQANTGRITKINSAEFATAQSERFAFPAAFSPSLQASVLAFQGAIAIKTPEISRFVYNGADAGL